MTVKILLKGKKYRVAQEGCSLSVLITIAPYAWRYERVRLFVGKMIEYVGERRGPGHDNVVFDIFKIKDAEGEFEPNSWGSADLECLEEVDDGD